jgi:hypothetical protein
VRNAYAAHEAGATGYYADEGARYTNPHERGVREMLHKATRDWPELWGMVAVNDATTSMVGDETGEEVKNETDETDEFGDRILDLSCGSGEVTAALVAAGVPPQRIDACDPYTHEAFSNRLGTQCERWSFEDVANGEIADRRWRTIVCSFAMHLCSKDYLPTLCMMLACSAKHLVILTPHKRPEIDAAWGGFMLHRREVRDKYWRIRLRWYSTDAPVDDDAVEGDDDDDLE